MVPGAPLATEAEVSALSQATQAHRSAAWFAILAVVGYVGSLSLSLAAALLLWAWAPSSDVKFVAFVPAALALASGLFGQRLAAGAAKRRKAAMDEAYKEALESFLRKSDHPMTGAQLAAGLGLDLEMVEQQLVRMNVGQDIASSITDDGEIVFSLRREPLRDTASESSEDGQWQVEQSRVADRSAPRS